MISDDLSRIAIQANLQIFTDEKNLGIKHKFRLNNKTNWGILALSAGGVFLNIAPFIKRADTTSKIIGVTMGLFLLVGSIAALIRQLSEGLKIEDNIIVIQYNLKRTVILLNRSMKIKMKTEVVQIRRSGTVGSEFIYITHYLQKIDAEIIILKYQMDSSNAGNAKRLGNAITRMISDKIRK